MGFSCGYYSLPTGFANFISRALRHSAAAARDSANERMRSRTRSRDRRTHSGAPGWRTEDHERYDRDRSGRSASPRRRDNSRDRYRRSHSRGRTTFHEDEQLARRERLTTQGASASGNIGSTQHDDSNAAALEALGVSPSTDHSMTMVPVVVVDMYDTMMVEIREAKTRTSWNIRCRICVITPFVCTKPALPAPRPPQLPVCKMPLV